MGVNSRRRHLERIIKRSAPKQDSNFCSTCGASKQVHFSQYLDHDFNQSRQPPIRFRMRRTLKLVAVFGWLVALVTFWTWWVKR